VTPAAIYAAGRFNIIDRPVGLKIHKTATPLLGGVAVYIAFAVAAVATLPLTPTVTGLLVGGLVAVIVGVVDEKVSLPPLVHLIGQAVVAGVAILAGVGFVRTISLPTAGLTAPGLVVPGAVGLLFTLVWLVGMMNTINFLDGLDGLASGVVALAALLLAIWASEPRRFFLPGTHQENLFLPLALAGALIGFLPFNWRPARIFLGDSGALFLGLAVGALSITGATKLGTALLVLIIPVLDVAWAIVRRSMHGRSFLSGDKQHVYHRLLELGVGYRRVVLLFYLLCVALGALDLLLLKLLKLIAFIVLAGVMAAGFWLLEIRASRLANSHEPPEGIRRAGP